MERVLSQDEIDAMVRAARGRSDTAQQATRDIKPCSFRHSGQLTSEQVRTINGLHETFARTLTQSLGAYLRVAFETTLVSIEQLAYGEFLERVAEVTYMVSFNIPQMEASGAIQIDHSLVFPLIDVLLGGKGQCQPLSREVSDIEEQIMEGVARIICRELASAWTPFIAGIELERRRTPAQMQRFLGATEKTLCLRFESKLAGGHGALNLIFPTSIANTLLRKLSADRSYGKSRGNSRFGQRLAERMLDCRFSITLALTEITLPILSLMTLRPNDICDLHVPVRSPASLQIAGRKVFESNPVRHGRHRAAQLGNPTFVYEERHQ